MCAYTGTQSGHNELANVREEALQVLFEHMRIVLADGVANTCLLYTSDAADESSSV